MSKIIQLTAENIKRLRAVTIKPDGNLVVVGGRNGQGKTSTLDSIAYALGGKDEIPNMPVRNGEQKAKIVLELDDLVIKRTFTAEGGTTLVVENKDGAKYPSPQTILDRLTGKLTFDPLAFIRLDAKEQAAALKKLVGLDLSDLDAQRKKVYDERTLIHRDCDVLKVDFERAPHFPEAGTEEQSAAAIIAEIEQTTERNRKAQELKDKPPKLQIAVMEAEDQENKIKKEIAVLEESLVVAKKRLTQQQNRKAELLTAMQKAAQEAEQAEMEDVEPLKEKLRTLETKNQHVRSNQDKAKKRQALESKREQAKALTDKIEQLDLQKETRLAEVKFPVEGLGFDENGVVFNGIPFDQASAAEQLRVSVAIAVGMNPKLRIGLVRDGSLLDDDSLKLLEELANEHDFQVWVERVGKGKECSVVIEDGAIVDQPQVEPEAVSVSE